MPTRPPEDSRTSARHVRGQALESAALDSPVAARLLKIGSAKVIGHPRSLTLSQPDSAVPRRDGEGLNPLLKRSDKAIGLAWSGDLFIDEVNDSVDMACHFS